MHSDLDKIPAAAREALQWVEDNRRDEKDLADISSSLTTKLCRLINSSSACAEVMKSQKTIGVYGPSQAGKSYLVSSMAAGEGGVLETVWDGEEINFLRHINPQGQDNEATGFITRFTHQALPAVPGFPVSVRVFREVEIAMILVNSYYNDVSKDEVTDDMSDLALMRHLRECERFADYNLKQEFVSVSTEDMVMFADYAQEVSGGKLAGLDADHSFYLQARAMLPRLGIKGRACLFSVFWGKCSAFTMLYELIAEEIVKLKGKARVYVPLGAFVERNEKGELMQRKTGTIISISTLQNLFKDGSELVVSLDESAEETVTVKFAYFAAIALEIAFPLPEGSRIDEFDVIDFPGARSRNSISIRNFTRASVTELLDDEKRKAIEFLRRGKVAYLFDRYSARKELDVLFLCIGANAQQEVVSLVEIMRSWVYKNVGETQSARGALKETSPLIGVLTRFDTVYDKYFDSVKNGITPKPSDSINSCFERMGKEEWMTEWVPGESFKNFFLARKPGIRLDWIERDDEGREVRLREDSLEIIEACSRELLKIENFNRYVRDPKGSLKALLTVNDGGVSAIISHLLKNYRTVNREERILTKLQAQIDEIDTILGEFCSSAGANASAEARQKGRELADALIELDSIAFIFGRLREILELDPADLSSRYNVGSADEANAIFFARVVLEEYSKRLASLVAGNGFNELCQRVVAGWNREKRTLMADDNAKDKWKFFFDKEKNQFKDDDQIKESFKLIMQSFHNEILKIVNSRQIDMRTRLTELLKPNEVEYKTHGTQRRLMQTRLACNFISGFNATMGIGFLPGTVTNELYEPKAVLREEERKVAPTVFRPGFDYPEMLPKLNEDTGSYGSYYLRGFLSALIYMMVNVNIHTASRYGFSREANDALCRILDEMKFGVQE